jgi:nucleoside-diphosphate-sugar epimerase
LAGTSAVVHVASVLSFSSVPEEVINPVLAGTLTALRSAAKTPSVKRFVLTSSSSAALFPKPDVKVFLDETTWNEESSALARSLPLTDGAKPWHVYCASKTEGEKSAWDFMKTEKVSTAPFDAGVSLTTMDAASIRAQHCPP